MIHAIKNRVYLDRKNFFNFGIGLSIAYVVAQVLALAICFTSGDHEYLGIIPGVLMAVGTISTLLVLTMGFYTDFDMAIKMGCTRKEYVVGKGISSLLQGLFCAGLSCLYMLLEVGIGKLIVEKVTTDFTFFIPVGAMLATLVLCVIATVAAYLLGSVLVKFERKGYLGMALVYFVLIGLSGPVQKLLNNSPDTWLAKAIIAIITAPIWILITGISLVGLLLIGIASRIYLTQSVRA